MFVTNIVNFSHFEKVGTDVMGVDRYMGKK